MNSALLARESISLAAALWFSGPRARSHQFAPSNIFLILSKMPTSASGFSRLVCIAPNDPFVLDAWARQLDPGEKLEFLSDGNLDFARALQLESQNRKLFLGWRSERYLMTVDDGIITRLRVEPSILTYACTRAIDALDVEFV